MKSRTALVAALALLFLVGTLLLHAAARSERAAPRAAAPALAHPAAETDLPGSKVATAAENERSIDCDAGVVAAHEELSTPSSARATLELAVQRGSEIARDARAWLVPGYFRELPADLEARPDLAARFVAADAEGVLRFADLGPGPYRVAIALDDLRLEQGLRLVPDRVQARIVIRLGVATVEGFVFDDQGSPAPSALVHLARRGYGRNPPPFECFARTDASGFYRIPRVGSGPQCIEAHLGGSLADDGIVRDAVIPVSGTARVDFGVAGFERVRWRGVVRNSAGAPVPGPGEIRVRAADMAEVRVHPFAADGSFELHLLPGRYDVALQPAGFFPSVASAGSIEVLASDLVRDLELPGSRLRVTLERPLDPAAQQLTLRRLGTEAATFALVPLPDGALVHDGLRPGEYALTSSAFLFEPEHTSELRFTLAEGQPELAIETRLAPKN